MYERVRSTGERRWGEGGCITWGRGGTESAALYVSMDRNEAGPANIWEHFRILSKKCAGQILLVYQEINYL